MEVDNMDPAIPDNTNGPGDDNDTDEIDSKTEASSQNSVPSSSGYNGFDEDDDDGTICPICLDSWTNSGAHRICSLKCGHLFGHKCVLRWLDSQSSKSCPTCKKAVRRSDLRFIYAKKLVAIDNMELENIKQQLQEAVIEKNSALQTVSRYISREHVLQQEIEMLKRKVEDLSLGGKPFINRLAANGSSNRIRLYMDKNLEVCNKGNCRECRAFDISVRHDTILITSRSPTDLFGGFGLKKLTLSNYKPIKFIPLHKESIRDLCFHPEDNKVLTVSTDKKFRVTDVHTTSTIFTASLDGITPWACGWSPRNGNDLYVGAQNGTTTIFDVRQLLTPKMTLSINGDYSPVVSVAGINDGSGSDILLVAKLNSVWAFQCQSDGTYTRHLLPLEGPFLSLKYDVVSKQILVSSRPNNQTPYARHTVCYLEKQYDPERITCNIVHTFRGGSTVKLLSKTSCFVPNSIVAGHHESKKSILLYSVNTGEEIGSCPTHENSVLDMKGFSCPNGKFLTYLNEKRLEFFKFNSF